MATLKLQPSGRTLDAAPGTPLRDLLFGEGVEFPCGGRGRCRACRVKVLAGTLAASPADLAALNQEDCEAGWRLACQHRIEGDLTLELAQWEMAILSDDSAFAFTPRDGFGIAIDLGTTTIAAQLLDLKTGEVLASRTALNTQARHGSDILSRAEYALCGGQKILERLIRDQLGTLVAEMAEDRTITQIMVVGNSVMHHLFCGRDLEPLATHPFQPRAPQAGDFTGAELGWQAEHITFLPCIGGLVGADILAGIAATGLAEVQGLTALIDLGTNGEVVVAQDGRMLATSTAAGPAFEGARIAYGMRAARGAIDAVVWASGALTCRVIGGGVAHGLCGSGLVDAVAAGLEAGAITPNGHLKADWPLRDTVVLTPRDVRELQLAKGAIAAGLRLLTAQFGATPKDIATLYLAGAFGNAIAPDSAVRIGLLPDVPIRPVGNTALKGAKQALFMEPENFTTLTRRTGHMALNDAPDFQDIFAEEMKLD